MHSLSVSMVPFVPWAVYNVAEQKGFWKKQGLDITVEVHATEDEYVEAVKEQRSDFYPLPLASTLDFINMGMDLVYLGALDLGNGHKHLIMKSDFLDQSLEGQEIALYSEECTTQYLVARYLDTKGLTLADVDLTYLNDEALADRFINGDLKVVLAFRGIKEKLKTEGRGTVVFTTGDYPDVFGVNTHRANLERISASDLIKFYQGRFDALEWIADPANRSEFTDIVNTITFGAFPNMTDDEIQSLLGEVRVPRSADLLAMNRSGLQDIFNEFREIIVKNRILDQQYTEGYTYERIINNQALIDALSPGRSE